MTILSQKGFSLLEIVIYLGLMSLVIGGALMAAYEILGNESKLEEKVVVSNEGDFLVKKIGWVLSEISDINYPGPGLSGNYLSINKQNYAKNPIILDQVDGKIRIKKGTGEPILINNSFVNVSSLSFKFNHIDNFKPADYITASFYLNGGYFEVNKPIGILGI